MYLAGLGVVQIKTRAGTQFVAECELEGIAPFIAWNVMIRSKVLLGQEALMGRFFADPTLLNVTCPGGVEIIDTHACLKSLAWVLADFEDGNLALVDDLVTHVLLNFTGELPVAEIANGQLLNYYNRLVGDWTKDRTPTTEQSIKNEVVHGA